MKTKNENVMKNQKFKMADIIAGALLLGAFWGFTEVFLKDVLSLGGKPFTAALMTGIGVAVMAFALAVYKRAGVIMMVAAATVAARMIIVPVLGCSAMCRANACVALLLLGGSMSAAMFLGRNKVNGRSASGGLLSGGAAMVSGGAFFFAGMAVAPCPYLLSFNQAGGFAAFFTAEVMYWAIFSALMFYPGYALGVKMRNSVFTLRNAQPAFYYTGTALGCIALVATTGFMLLV